ncbi:hypothetical protein B9Z55_007282 [Caenorhabditis nigoni]|uniref:Uncharacterized protein n=1 Tax=Caenorhabditis nigoni TaxID=1611254 RepID=A0A2G5V8V7_9PELO|nr:hypothetical protein B9Z55_007282 [Caenorhabditis nigoni]
MQISLLRHKLEGLKKERRYMEYEINGKPEVKVRRKAYEAKKAEAQKRRNEKVDRATMYAAEMERRVESLERNDKKQKEQFEKFKEVLRVLEDENVTYEEQIKTMQKSLRAAKLQKKSAM